MLNDFEKKILTNISFVERYLNAINAKIYFSDEPDNVFPLKVDVIKEAFLSNPDHPVYFIYTPKHCSWLNQIEIWFSILTKKLLKRGNFISKQNLKEQIERFIEYFNRVWAKPFKWTYNGKPCTS